MWSCNKENRFTPAERELYFYLLNECNINYWRMPICCPTSVIVAALGISKQTIMRAREGLRARGFIDFTEGVQNSKSPSYKLATFGTACVTDSGTAHGTIYNKTNTKDIFNKNMREENLSISLEELQKKFLTDSDWQHKVLELFPKEKIREEKLQEYICQFFVQLQAEGRTEREPMECRRHFVNWVKVQIRNQSKNDYANNTTKFENRRSSLQVTVGATSDYEKPF